MQRLPLVIAALMFASAASAQQTTTKLGSMGQVVGKPITGDSTGSGAASGEQTMAELLNKGYDIKAAVPNGGKFIVFMQKDQSAYACEFQSLTGARCGSIN
ncbi:MULTISPECIES: hypothetical protein [unclassified Rhizobium]|uniref:hypothetical protein n=1 Tax=unclassified Rhizobium TaxID=2613769 RepID=UPI001ADCC3F9|nr:MULTISPECIES: hypothetical protein [unclassified Rhizobium]MBO9098095.1 hypothetical protein [Rhizobium sp. L58/93]MBO9133122.1 hypothetical protein [Rhizobium sp. B209b/85]MBO9168245.1 hypothetical protein [Rhizobium sp. L245/93]MBO9184291.1 hypothetical protein [Rhizobium sp. E27B/91]QXZ84490.1 hypothetical protein J5287_02770 [Rhizobium sp. K1/93]